MKLHDIAQAAIAEDMTLAEHDARWHPNGYREGDKCLYRENMAKGDKADALNGGGSTGGIGGIFTGSAANYSRPSLLKIGTGEGSQVYGWGLYGSTVRGVAEGYATLNSGAYLKNGKPISDYFERTVAEALDDYGWDVAKTISGLQEKNKTLGTAARKENNAIIKELRAHGEEYRRKSGSIYEQTFFTDRAPGDESHLLKWYGKVPKKQKAWIKTQAEKEGINVSNLLWDGGEIQGAMLYNYLATPSYLGSPKAASEFLARAGIDGIKYPVDSYGGKTVKDGDKAGWNYVSFRDDNIRVDRKWRDGEEVDDEAPKFTAAAFRRYLDAGASEVAEDRGTSAGVRKGWLTRRLNARPAPSFDTKKRFASNPATAHWTVETEPGYIATIEPLRLRPRAPVSDAKDNTSVVKAMRRLFDNFGEVENSSDGIKVVFNKNDAGKMLMQSGASMRQFAPLMKELFESAILAWTEPPVLDVLEYRQYVNKFILPGETPKYVRFTVRVHKGEKGRKGVHAATVSDVALYECENAAGTNLANKSRGTNRTFVDNIIAQFLAGRNREPVEKAPKFNAAAFRNFLKKGKVGS